MSPYDLLQPLARRERILDPRTKVVLLLAISTAAVCIDHTRSLGVLFGLVIAGIGWIQPPWPRVRALAIFVALGTLGCMVSQAIFYSAYPRTICLTLLDAKNSWIGQLIGGLYIYWEGLAYGAIQSLRLSAMLCAGILVCWTTDSRDLLMALHRLRVPEGLSFMTMTAIRFLPLVLAEAAAVWSSQRLRGARIFRYGPVSLLVSAARILRPLFSNCVRRAATLAASAQSRAYDPTLSRTSLYDSSLRAVDWMIGGGAVAGILVLVIAKALFLLYVNEIYYLPQLRPLYSFVREML